MYNVSRNGAEIGKYPKEEIADGLTTGFFLPTDHCWKPGMAEWKLLSVEFAAPVDPTMPPPPPAATGRQTTPAGYEVPNSPPPAHASSNAAPAQAGVFKRIVVLLGAVFMPYIAWYWVFFDKSLGYTKAAKVFFACWTGLILVAAINTDSQGTGANSGRSNDLQSKIEYIDRRKANPYDVDSDQERPEPYSWAISQAQGLIRKQLKSPSSAKFSGFSETSRKKTYDDGVIQYYFVSGWVESQNSFGTMLRDDYLICFLATENSTKLGVKYLRLGEQSTGKIPIQCKSMFSYPEEAQFFKERMQAAERGDAQAQFDVGTCYEEAKGTKPDPAAGLKWNRKAADQGHPAAAFSVGMAYTTGSGTERNPTTAASWYKKAAYGGHVFSQFVLANHYTSGTGIEKNLTEAYALLNIVIGKADGTTVVMAQKNLAGIEKEMSNAEIEQGKLRIGQLEALIKASTRK
jgi:TPR repeat protein